MRASRRWRAARGVAGPRVALRARAWCCGRAVLRAHARCCAGPRAVSRERLSGAAWWAGAPTRRRVVGGGHLRGAQRLSGRRLCRAAGSAPAEEGLDELWARAELCRSALHRRHEHLGPGRGRPASLGGVVGVVDAEAENPSRRCRRPRRRLTVAPPADREQPTLTGGQPTSTGGQPPRNPGSRRGRPGRSPSRRVCSETRPRCPGRRCARTARRSASCAGRSRSPGGGSRR